MVHLWITFEVFLFGITYNIDIAGIATTVIHFQHDGQTNGLAGAATRQGDLHFCILEWWMHHESPYRLGNFRLQLPNFAGICIDGILMQPATILPFRRSRYEAGSDGTVLLFLFPVEAALAVPGDNHWCFCVPATTTLVPTIFHVADIEGDNPLGHQNFDPLVLNWW